MYDLPPMPPDAAPMPVEEANITLDFTGTEFLDEPVADPYTNIQWKAVTVDSNGLTNDAVMSDPNQFLVNYKSDSVTGPFTIPMVGEAGTNVLDFPVDPNKVSEFALKQPDAVVWKFTDPAEADLYLTNRAAWLLTKGVSP